MGFPAPIGIRWGPVGTRYPRIGRRRCVQAVVASEEGQQQLDRIYIDECHVILNNRTDFRRKLQQLGELSYAEAPIILLTATLPPSYKSELWRRMGWNPLQVRIFRARTSRANIGYRTIWVEGQGKAIPQYAAVVTEAFAKHPSGKAVVYCNAVNETKELAAELDCRAFYYDAPDKLIILQ